MLNQRATLTFEVKTQASLRTIAFGVTVMGGAVIERDTTLLPLSLVPKEMNMLKATYEGSPAEIVRGSTLLPDVTPTKSQSSSPPDSKR